MEEQLQQYLKELVRMLKEGGQFAMEQLPLFVQEYLSYYTYYHSITLILFLVLGIGCIFLTKHGYKNVDNSITQYDLYVGLGVLGVIIGTIGTIHNFYNLIQITIAPRLYLVENLLQLVK